METLVALSQVKLKRTEKSGTAAKIPDEKSIASEKECIYFNALECVIPHGSLNICRACPMGYLYYFGYVVKNVYGRIAAMAIDILKKDNLNDIGQGTRVMGHEEQDLSS